MSTGTQHQSPLPQLADLLTCQLADSLPHLRLATCDWPGRYKVEVQHFLEGGRLGWEVITVIWIYGNGQ